MLNYIGYLQLGPILLMLESLPLNLLICINFSEGLYVGC